MDKNIFEEGPRRGHAAGDTSLEQQASQLASDIKYKARQKMKGTSGSNMSPGQVQQLYRQLLNASPAPGGVKAIVKKKLFGEQVDPGVIPVVENVASSKSDVFGRVFVEGGGQKEEVIEEEDQKFVVRVTDRATGNTTYRKADRAKIAELRANKNISSVEITGRKKADDAYGDKKAKKDYDGDGKVESGSKEHAGAVHNAIQRKKGGVADGQDTRKEEYVDEGLRSAVKRLLGKKDAPAEKKPESRGEQLRKKYNVGPERSDTSAKKQILDRTRAKAERDKKQYGGSVYTKSVADKSKAAHDRYLKGGYSKYGADDARGKGNKARRRAEALKKEDFNWLVDTLISEGYNLSSYTVDQFYDFCEEVIYEKEENGEKKLDVMKGKNKVNTSPTIGESIRAELDALKAQKIEEQEAAMKAAGPSPEERQQLMNKDKMLKKKIMMQKQTMQMQKQGRLPLNYNEESDAVRYCPKCDKDETRDECRYGGEYWDENSKPAKAEDPRGMKTSINLAKNKLRAMGLKMSYDMEGESIDEVTYPSDFKKGSSVATPRKGRPQQHDQKTDKYGRRKTVDESAEDRLRDRRMERGGVGGNVDYSRPPARKSTNAELGIDPKAKTAAQKAAEKKYGKGASAMDIVRAEIRKKHGKGSIK